MFYKRNCFCFFFFIVFAFFYAADFEAFLYRWPCHESWDIWVKSILYTKKIRHWLKNMGKLTSRRCRYRQACGNCSYHVINNRVPKQVSVRRRNRPWTEHQRLWRRLHARRGGGAGPANQRPFTFFSPRPHRRTLPKNKRIKVGETYLFLCGAS